MIRPNGLAFSPDEKKLYINDSQEGNIRVFDVKADGTLENGRVFADMKVPGKDPLADGMKVDSQGKVYSTGPEGIWIFSPQGKLLGKIFLPENPTNIAWGDRDYKTLYITTYNSVYRIRLKIAGIRPGAGILGFR
jgi:gluconolactonase